MKLTLILTVLVAIQTLANAESPHLRQLRTQDDLPPETTAPETIDPETPYPDYAEMERRRRFP
ncbi:hypothetical protein DVH05_009764 [Phytophthora capsici]|nr:hypothetical protein DVH05_009764 [Phytophthora capsici]